MKTPYNIYIKENSLCPLFKKVVNDVYLRSVLCVLLMLCPSSFVSSTFCPSQFYVPLILAPCSLAAIGLFPLLSINVGFHKKKELTQSKTTLRGVLQATFALRQLLIIKTAYRKHRHA